MFLTHKSRQKRVKNILLAELFLKFDESEVEIEVKVEVEENKPTL